MTYVTAITFRYYECIIYNLSPFIFLIHKSTHFSKLKLFLIEPVKRYYLSYF